jgi:hypothetical protein
VRECADCHRSKGTEQRRGKKAQVVVTEHFRVCVRVNMRLLQLQSWDTSHNTSPLTTMSLRPSLHAAEICGHVRESGSSCTAAALGASRHMSCRHCLHAHLRSHTQLQKCQTRGEKGLLRRKCVLARGRCRCRGNFLCSSLPTLPPNAYLLHNFDSITVDSDVSRSTSDGIP